MWAQKGLTDTDIYRVILTFGLLICNKPLFKNTSWKLVYFNLHPIYWFKLLFNCTFCILLIQKYWGYVKSVLSYVPLKSFLPLNLLLDFFHFLTVCHIYLVILPCIHKTHISYYYILGVFIYLSFLRALHSLDRHRDKHTWHTPTPLVHILIFFLFKWGYPPL